MKITKVTKIVIVYPQGKNQHGNGCGLPLNDSFFQRGYGNEIVIRCPNCKRENNYFKEMITINPVKSGMKCWWCGYEDAGEGETIK